MASFFLTDQPPERVVHATEPDGRLVSAVSFDANSASVYHGLDVIRTCPMSPATARRIGWFLLRWWAVDCWFGLRPRLLSWAAARAMGRR